MTDEKDEPMTVFNSSTHLVGKVYDLSQDNMNLMIAEIERLNKRLD